MWDMGVEYAVDLYGVGKCGQFGDLTAEKPPFYEPVEVVKWDAWNKLKGQSAEDAEKAYVSLVAQLEAKYN